MMTNEEVAAILRRALPKPETQIEQSVEILRAMPREYRAVWLRMGIRLQNGVSIAKAQALFWREIEVIDARGAD